MVVETSCQHASTRALQHDTRKPGIDKGGSSELSDGNIEDGYESFNGETGNGPSYHGEEETEEELERVLLEELEDIDINEENVEITASGQRCAVEANAWGIASNGASEVAEHTQSQQSKHSSRHSISPTKPEGEDEWAKILEFAETRASRAFKEQKACNEFLESGCASDKRSDDEDEALSALRAISKDYNYKASVLKAPSTDYEYSSNFIKRKAQEVSKHADEQSNTAADVTISGAVSSCVSKHTTECTTDVCSSSVARTSITNSRDTESPHGENGGLASSHPSPLSEIHTVSHFNTAHNGFTEGERPSDHIPTTIKELPSTSATSAIDYSDEQSLASEEDAYFSVERFLEEVAATFRTTHASTEGAEEKEIIGNVQLDGNVGAETESATEPEEELDIQFQRIEALEREYQEKKQQREEKWRRRAATDISRIFKGWKARRLFAHLREERREYLRRWGAATTICKVVRGWSTRRWFCLLRRAKKREQQLQMQRDRDQAKEQAKIREEEKRLRQKETENYAGLKVCAFVRMSHARLQYIRSLERRRDASAIKLQAWWRAMLAMRCARRLRLEKRREKAASLVQHNFKVVCFRRQVMACVHDLSAQHQVESISRVVRFIWACRCLRWIRAAALCHRNRLRYVVAIQTWYQYRKCIVERRRQEQVSSRIIARFLQAMISRGLARKILSVGKMSLWDKRSRCSVVIQACTRGWLTRRRIRKALCNSKFNEVEELAEVNVDEFLGVDVVSELQEPEAIPRKPRISNANRPTIASADTKAVPATTKNSSRGETGEGEENVRPKVRKRLEGMIHDGRTMYGAELRSHEPESYRTPRSSNSRQTNNQVVEDDMDVESVRSDVSSAHGQRHNNPSYSPFDVLERPSDDPSKPSTRGSDTNWGLHDDKAIESWQKRKERLGTNAVKRRHEKEKEMKDPLKRLEKFRQHIIRSEGCEKSSFSSSGSIEKTVTPRVPHGKSARERAMRNTQRKKVVPAWVLGADKESGS
eukprot:gb/GECG01016001.1/.p1 GENE.gb/GECG01016001.1/~~gb/GECG01016001.1/.p1  ORF type:complete len:996 (+),score=140.54 gb/GECG01016001.1/:1-2988(+)